jgi:hypothetical protein
MAQLFVERWPEKREERNHDGQTPLMLLLAHNRQLDHNDLSDMMAVLGAL